MRLLQKANLSVALSLISLVSCAEATPPCPVIKCHEYTKTELSQIRAAIEVLPNDSILLSVLEDRQRVCISLK